MNCEQTGEKMLELMDKEAGPLTGEALAHCGQCRDCRAAYRAVLSLRDELGRLPAQKPGPELKAALLAGLEPLQAKPVGLPALLAACALLLAPALAASAWQYAATGSFAASVSFRLEELNSWAASVPVLAGLRASLFSAGGYAARVQSLTYSLAVITLALIGRTKPHRIGR